MHKTNSQQLYDQFAPYYQTYSKERAAYLNAINDRVVACARSKNHYTTVVDVGSGDGLRIKALTHRLHASTTVLIDNSEAMCLRAKENTSFKVWFADISATTFPHTKDKFTTVLCLWNVLGHIVGEKARRTAFTHLAQLCDTDGHIYLDVNNRFNLEQYGWKVIVRNVWVELFLPKVREGSVLCAVSITKKMVMDSLCHFFAPWEVRRLARTAGLYVEKIQYIDYRTGKQRRFFWQGQIFVVLRKTAKTP